MVFYSFINKAIYWEQEIISPSEIMVHILLDLGLSVMASVRHPSISAGCDIIEERESYVYPR